MRAIRLSLLSILLIGLFGLSTTAAQPAGGRAAPAADSASSDREMPDGELPETMPSGEPSGEAVASSEPSGDGVPLPPHRALGAAEQADEVGPPVYWLKDDDGELHAVPGMTMADFWRAYEMIHRLDAPVRQRAFVLSRLRIEAKLAAQPVAGAIAPVMHLNIEVGLHVNRTGWVRVPLGLAGAVYGGDARLVGSNAPHYIAFEGDDGGYVLWIDVQEPGEHQLVLPLKLPTEETGSGGRCKFALPLAAQSELRLSMPTEDVDVTLTGAAVESRDGDVESQQEDRQSQDRDDKSRDENGESQDADDADDGDEGGDDEDGSVLVYSGLGREIDVRWRRRDRAEEATPTVLEALDGTVLVNIDGQTITSEALLKVRSLGGPLQRLYVRLPDRAELIPRPQPGYRVSVLTDLASLPADLLRGDTAGQPLDRPEANYAEVMLEKPTTEPIEIRLFTQRRHRVDDSMDVASVDGLSTDGAVTPTGTVTSSPTAVDLGGFEVLGALRQSGYMAVGVVGDWQITWGPPRGVRQVPPIPAVLNRGQFVAGFEYVSQPFSLPLRVTARKSRIGVEPTYVVRVEPDGVHIEAQLKYAIRSANAFGVSVDMTGWTVEEIGPANVVDLDGVDTDATSPLFVPFFESVLGEVEVLVRARRELDDQLSFTLPRPVANTLGPAELVVLPADNVIVSPLTDEIEGLRLETAPPSLPLPPRQQEPLVYRAGLEQSRFVANAEVMSGVVSVDIQTQLRLSADDVVIEQLLSYDAAYEAVGDVDLLVPITDAAVVVMAGEEVLDLQDSPNQGSLPPGFARVVAVLPSPRIGEFDLTVRQRRPLDDLKPLAQWTDKDTSTSGADENRKATQGQAAVASRQGGDGDGSRRGSRDDGAVEDGAVEDGTGEDGGGERIVVPLVMPAGVEVRGSRVSVATESGVQCDIIDQPTWDHGGRFNGDGSGGVLTATAAPGKAAAARQIRLTLRRDSQLTRGGIRVERAWVRTRLNDRSQDVIAAYRLTTLADQLELVMPVTWRSNGSAGGASDVEARLDGTPVAVLERERAISIAIDQSLTSAQSSATDQMSATDRAHVLELRFTLPPLDVGASRFTLSAPTFAGPVWIRRLYWEVDVPRGRRVLGGTDGFVGEYQWQRRGLVWSRVSSLTSADLASWLGVALPMTDTATANRYLFSAIDPPAELEISAPRLSTIVLWASGASLVVGLLLIHVPRLRHPGVLWVCGVAVVASSVMYLELAVLIAQASMIGLALVFLAAMLERFFSARRRDLPLRTAGSSLVVNRRASPARFGPLLAGKSDSTQTLPVATSGSSHGSES